MAGEGATLERPSCSETSLMIGGDAREGSEFVVTCNPVQRHEATSQEGVMNVHLCFQHSSWLTNGTQSLHTEPRSREIHCREVPNEIRVNWKTFLDLFKEFKTARANVQEVKLEPRQRPTVASATREEHSHCDS